MYSIEIAGCRQDLLNITCRGVSVRNVPPILKEVLGNHPKTKIVNVRLCDLPSGESQHVSLVDVSHAMNVDSVRRIDITDDTDQFVYERVSADEWCVYGAFHSEGTPIEIVPKTHLKRNHQGLWEGACGNLPRIFSLWFDSHARSV
jgi:hypothetical protein